MSNSPRSTSQQRGMFDVENDIEYRSSNEPQAVPQQIRMDEEFRDGNAGTPLVDIKVRTGTLKMRSPKFHSQPFSGGTRGSPKVSRAHRLNRLKNKLRNKILNYDPTFEVQKREQKRLNVIKPASPLRDLKST